MFYSHVICSGTKIDAICELYSNLFYSHVICSGTKIGISVNSDGVRFTVT